MGREKEKLKEQLIDVTNILLKTIFYSRITDSEQASSTTTTTTNNNNNNNNNITFVECLVRNKL